MRTLFITLSLVSALSFTPGLVGRAFAGSRPLVRLPIDQVTALGPALVGGSMALVESHPNGRMKQVTMLLFVKAKLETVYDVISHPGDYKKFVPNMSRSSWEEKPDGTKVSSWQLELPISEFDGINVYKFYPASEGQPAAIELNAIDPNDDACYRWEMMPVRGGTILVQYGYTDVVHSNGFVTSFVKRQATMEHGLALAAQLVMCDAMKHEAERRTPAGTLEHATRESRHRGLRVGCEPPLPSHLIRVMPA